MLKEIVLCDKRGEGLIKVKGGLGENVNILIFIYNVDISNNFHYHISICSSFMLERDCLIRQGGGGLIEVKLVGVWVGGRQDIYHTTRNS
jgi:hypothetical protein